MLSDQTGLKLNKYVPDYVVFDLETTGTSCTNDAVIEISAVKVIGGSITDEFTTLVDPGRPIPFYATNVNGISDAMVQGAPAFRSAFSDFLDFAGDSILTGHNIASFDMKFLYRDAQLFWGKTVGNDYVDTLPMARKCLPQLAHHRLVDLAQYYGISPEGAHRALNDCRMNQQVFEKLGRETTGISPEMICPKCGQLLKKRSGRYGDFLGCTGFPNCRYTRNP